ncbi:MAG: histidine phosphatase family protein [Elainellaceae cyanobacterium]
MATRVILVRHGESTYNAQRRVQGHCDESTLTEAGRIAARQVGAALHGISFDAIYSSPLRRAKQTADLILETLGDEAYADALHVTEKLLEISLPLWEGLTFKEVEEKFPDGYRDWRDRPHKLRMKIPTPEGPVDFFPVPSLFEQARQFWQDVLHRHSDSTILVVAHSGINRTLIYTALGLAPDRYTCLHVSNCGISVLNFTGGLGQPVQLESLNLTSPIGEPLPRLRPKNRGPRFLLVRHGETDWNRDQRFQGQIDVPLNDTGRQQAEQCAEFLKSFSIDRVITSPMLRPKQTAEAIAAHHISVKLELLDGLCEISHGLWEGKLEEEIEQAYPGELRRWKQSPETVQMPDGENLQQVWERAIATWNAILASITLPDDIPDDVSVPPVTVVVVAHDAINKAILCHLVGWGPEHFWKFKQGNGSVTVIDYPRGVEGTPLIQAMNITSFVSGGVLDQTAAGAL